MIRMQVTAPWRVIFRSSYPRAPKAKAVKDHFLCSRMLCLAEFASDTSKANFASGELPTSQIFMIHQDKETSSRST